MRASQQIVDFIGRCEGFREKAYKPLPTDRWTYGYGFTRKPNDLPVAEGDTITKEEALVYLNREVQKIAVALTDLHLPLMIKQRQFDAVVSLCYNIGFTTFKNSTTGKLFLIGEDISSRFQKYDMSGGQHIPGLLDRRLKEVKIYKENDYGR